jgi:8-oxo-dGTP diphosphatase
MSLRTAYQKSATVMNPLFLFVLRTWTLVSGQQRARIAVVNEDGEILLVRGVIGHHDWSLPGGGIEKIETPLQAAIRECQEETGIVLDPERAQPLVFVQKHTIPKIGYDAHLFYATANKQALPTKLYNPIEIIELGWFPLDTLPSPLSGLAKIAIDQLPQTR